MPADLNLEFDKSLPKKTLHEDRRNDRALQLPMAEIVPPARGDTIEQLLESRYRMGAILNAPRMELGTWSAHFLPQGGGILQSFSLCAHRFGQKSDAARISFCAQCLTIGI